MNVFELDHTVLKVVDPFNPADTLLLNDAEVIGQGSLTVTGHLDWRGGTAHVPVHVFPGGTAFVGSGTLPPVAVYSFFNEGAVVQSGGFFIDGDGINAGTWTIADGLAAGLAGNGSFQNIGDVVLCGDASGSLTFNLPVTNQPSGSFTGDGTLVFGQGLNNLGWMEPGCPVGSLTVAHGFSLGAGADMYVEGDQPGQYDRLTAFGDIAAGGTLRITTPPGFILQDTIDIIHATGAFSGVFAAVEAPQYYKVLYRPNGVSLYYSPTVGTSGPGSPVGRVYPTLAADQVFVELPGEQTVRLVDAFGRVVRQIAHAGGTTVLPVYDLPEGLYRVVTESGVFVFVKTP
jgi:hypothetical protein